MERDNMLHQGSERDRKQLQLWYCEDCRGVHLRTDHVSLTFNNEEFTQLSSAVMEIYQNDIAVNEPEIVEQAEKDEVLESDLIA